MAGNLYGTLLDGASDSARVVDAPNTSSGVSTALDSLAKGVNAFVSRHEDQVRAKRQQVADARAAQDQSWQAEDRAYKTEGNEIGNDVTMGVSQINTLGSLGDAFSTSGEQTGMAADSVGYRDPRIVKDVTKAADDVNRTSTAVDQGKLPEISRTAQVDLLFNRLTVKYPGRAHDIAKQFQELGVHSALFDELKTETDQIEAAAKASGEEKIKMTTTAQENLDPETFNGMSENDRVSWGLNYTKNMNTIELQSKQASLQGTLQSTQQSSYNFNKQQESDQFFTNSQNLVMNALAPIAQNMSKLMLSIGEPGSSPENDVKLGQLVNLAQQQSAALVEQTIARGGFTKPEDIANVRNTVNSYVKSMILDPYANRDKNFAQAASAFQTHFNLGAAVSAPVIYDLKHRFGINPSDIPAVLQAVGSDKNLVTALTREFQGAGKAGINDNIATIRLTNALAVMRGDKSLSNIDTKQERQAVIASTWSYVNQNASAVAQGKGNGDMWMNSTRSLVVASAGFNPNTSASSLVTASRAMFGEASVNAVNKLRTGDDTGQEAKELSTGLRAAAAQTLSSTQKKIGSFYRENDNPPYHIVVDEGGHYKIVQNPKWSAPRVNGQGTGFMRAEGVVGGVVPRPSVPTEAQQLVEAANHSLSFLVGTKAWDPDAPKGTSKEVRRMWALGELTPDQKQEKAQQRQRGDFGTMASALEKDLMHLPDTIPTEYQSGGGDGTDPHNIVFGYGKYGKPDQPLSTMSMGDVVDFGKNVLIPNTKAAGYGRDSRGVIGTSAGGAYGITQETLKNYAPRLFGSDWKSKTYDAEAQSRLGEAIFQNARHSVAHMRSTWESLTKMSDSQVENLRNMPWDAAKRIIVKAETGHSLG